MAVQLVTNIKKYMGLSADDKPESTDTETVPAGSTFLETDTGKLYRYNGSGWVFKDPDDEDTDDPTPLLLQAVLLELRTIRERFELATA